jgi:hypothetical protein
MGPCAHNVANHLSLLVTKIDTKSVTISMCILLSMASITGRSLAGSYHAAIKVDDTCGADQPPSISGT